MALDHIEAARQVCENIATNSHYSDDTRRVAAIGLAALQDDVMPPSVGELLGHLIDSLVTVENRLTRIELTLAYHGMKPIL